MCGVAGYCHEIDSVSIIHPALFLCCPSPPLQQDGRKCKGGRGAIVAQVEGPYEGVATCYGTQKNDLATCLGGSKDSCTWVFPTPGCTPPPPTPAPRRPNRKRKRRGPSGPSRSQRSPSRIPPSVK